MARMGPDQPAQPKFQKQVIFDIKPILLDKIVESKSQHKNKIIMNMFIHIALAVLSIGYATFAIFRLSKSSILTSYTLIISTFLSGGILLVSDRSNLERVCITGVGYLGFVLFFTFAIRKKSVKPLATAN